MGQSLNDSMSQSPFRLLASLFHSLYLAVVSKTTIGGIMDRNSSRAELNALLTLVDESYVRKAWHGPNLRGSLRGITSSEALWRPAPNRHNIWEILIHCAYWKYIVRRRITGEKKGSFPLNGSNWFESPAVLSQSSLRQDIALLDKVHETMVDAITGLSPKQLSHIPKNSKVTNRATIRGIASHDVYHAGQIQLLKKLQQ
jgi:uncharacterized damage-inducible protein DinB